MNLKKRRKNQKQKDNPDQQLYRKSDKLKSSPMESINWRIISTIRL